MRIGAVPLMIILGNDDILPCSRSQERIAEGIGDQITVLCRSVGVLGDGYTESMSSLWCVLRVVPRFVLLGGSELC